MFFVTIFFYANVFWSKKIQRFHQKQIVPLGGDELYYLSTAGSHQYVLRRNFFLPLKVIVSHCLVLNNKPITMKGISFVRTGVKQVTCDT